MILDVSKEQKVKQSEKKNAWLLKVKAPQSLETSGTLARRHNLTSY